MKSILIIDTPKSCIECLCMSWDDEDDWIGCHLTSRQTGVWSEGKADRPGWCPLKQLPKEKSNYDFMGDYEIMEAKGWNACLKEIEK